MKVPLTKTSEQANKQNKEGKKRNTSTKNI